MRNRLFLVICCFFLLIQCGIINSIYVPSTSGQTKTKSGMGIKTLEWQSPEPTTEPVMVYQNYTNVKVQHHSNDDNLRQLYQNNFQRPKDVQIPNNEQFDLEPTASEQPQKNYRYSPSRSSQNVDDNNRLSRKYSQNNLESTTQKINDNEFAASGRYPAYQQIPNQEHGVVPQQVTCTLNCKVNGENNQNQYGVYYQPGTGTTSYGNSGTFSNSNSRPQSNNQGCPPGGCSGSYSGVTISGMPYQPIRGDARQYYPQQSQNHQPTYQTQTNYPSQTSFHASTQYQPPTQQQQPNYHQNVIIPQNYYSGKLQNVPRQSQPYHKCPQGATGQFPHEGSCNQFLNCWNGRGVVQNCAPGTLFNPETLECDFPSKVNCMSGPRTARYERLTVKEEAACPSGFSGIVPHYQDCSKFLSCDHGRQVEMNCPPGTLFDTQMNICDHAYKVQCVNEEKKETRYIESSRYIQDPGNSPQYGTGGEKQTSYQNTYQNNQFGTTGNNGYGSGNKGFDQPAKCPAHFSGLMAHPTDCSKFLNCANGMTYIQNCGAGTHFNPVINICDHIHNVKCGSGTGQQVGHVPSSSNQQGSQTGQNYPQNSNQNWNQNKPNSTEPDWGQTRYDGHSNNQQLHNNGQYQPEQVPTSSNQQWTETSQFHPPNNNNKWNSSQPNWDQNQQGGRQPINNQQWYHNGQYNPGHFVQYPNVNNQGQVAPNNKQQSTHTPQTQITGNNYPNQWGQNGHYTSPPQNQGKGFPDENDNLDQQIEDVWHHGSASNTPSHETLTVSPTTNKRNQWPPPFPTNTPSNDYVFDYEDLVEPVVPLTIPPKLPNAHQIQKVPGILHKVQCTNQTYDCGNQYCIMQSFVCNGQKDCANGNDEQDCSLRLQDFIKTAGTKLAVKETIKSPNVTLAWCAAICAKGNCKGFNYRKHDGTCYILDSNVGTSGALIILPMYDYFENQKYTISCGQINGYLCNNKKCIAKQRLCDGVNDCGDGADEKGCTADAFDYKIRLVGGENEHSGRLQLEVFGKTGYICDDMFGLKNADVACRELGYSLGALEVRGNSFYAQDISANDTLYLMDDVTCVGNETSLRDCDFNGWGKSNCKPQEIVGVICKTPVEICPKNYWKCENNLECLPIAFVCDGVHDCTDKSDENAQLCDAPIKLRLTQGTKGRLEVMHKGIWGTVCDDDFNDDAAKVVCQQLGYTGTAKVVKDGQFGPGLGPIWLDQVFCRGNESALEECIHWDWGEHNCEHSEDVGVICNLKALPGTARHQQHIDLTSHNSDDSKLPDSCGLRSDAIFNNQDDPEDAHFRVVMAGSARAGEYPWQASIRVNGRTKSAHWCGAIVVSSKYVLTAAHCLVGFSKGAYFVVAGDYNVDTDEGTEQEAYIDDFIIHSKFGQGNRMNNDIALIRLKGKGFKITKDVQPVCLPPSNTPYPVGLNCTISGFGSIESGKSKASHDLRAGWIPILSKEVCQMPHVYGAAITDGMLCAGYMENGVDACDGDSGGPLACLHDGVFKLFGITSWGQHCGYANKPGVYVNVAKYRTWIENTMKELSRR